ncbi:hypothetical protein AWB79_03460 [Caballeronia hypogeia]|uniref:Lipoprotein n=1 Tax=Caballeronia hypogeia TaxID=1777140 RepID=A0A158BCA8_9BURK|nr:hypothetical protein [Caballeronia hypogeia]SAK67701.1 hypothetical protein AWB79_03460 [Caballeronia hypogeia]
MRTILSLASGLLLCATAHAGPLDVSAPASGQTLAALAPATQKVYPPLPTLAMLPPAGSDDDEPPARTVGKKGKKTRRVVDCKCNGPEPRLVVSDESRSYLKDVDHRIDIALGQ